MTEKNILGPEELFNKFYPAKLGASFKLLGYCSQIVQGTNYALEIEETLSTNPPVKSTKYHYFHVDLDGNIIDQGTKDHGPTATDIPGGWHCQKI